MSDQDSERGVALPETLSAREREAFERLSAARLLFVLPIQHAGEQRHVICEPRNVDGDESIVPLALLIGNGHVNGFDFDDFSSFVDGADAP